MARRRALRDWDDEDPFRPEPGDYTLTPCGSLGSKICVGEVEGRFIGEFSTQRSAERAICQRMEREKFFSTTWWVSDHGNVDQLSIRCRRPRRKR